MADIALLVVEEFERTTKKKMQQGRGRSQQPIAGTGDRAGAASAPKMSEWGSKQNTENGWILMKV